MFYGAREGKILTSSDNSQSYILEHVLLIDSDGNPDLREFRNRFTIINAYEHQREEVRKYPFPVTIF